MLHFGTLSGGFFLGSLYDINFFPVKAEVLYFLIQRRFNIMDSLGAPYGKKRRLLLFGKSIFLSKKWILAPKRRLFHFIA